MFFRPNPNDELIISGVTYRVAEHPSAPGIPHGQEGRAGIVYHLHPTSSGKKAVGENLALKVFKPRFRLPYLVSQAERIATYADLPGLQVCRRTVLSPSRHVELLRQHPDLTYAVLMPWIEGPTWLEVVLEKKPYSREQSLALARALTETLVRMEEQGIAHCDLSGPNVMLPVLAGREGLELVDVEGIYAPGLPQPEALSSGSAGYAHKAIRDGAWNPKADRFAGAVLLAEMLGWCDEQVCQAAWSESYFEPGETQKNGKRYQTLLTSLRRHWDDGIANLFERAWRSDTLADCPTFGEWLVALPVSSEQRVESREQKVVSNAELSVERGKGVESGELLVERGKEVSDELPTAQVETVREVRAFMQAARRMEEQNNLDDALMLYRQARELATTDPALRSLAHEIALTLQDLEVRRRGKESLVPVMPVSPAPPVVPVPTLPVTIENRSSHKGKGWVWALVIVGLIVAGLIGLGIQQQQAEEHAMATAQAYEMQSTATAQVRENYVASIVNSTQLVFGPESGDLTHAADDSNVEVYYASVSEKDFIADAKFYNPYPTTTGSWDYGFLFRYQGGNDQYRLVIFSDTSWKLKNTVPDSGDEWHSDIIAEGTITNLNVEGNGYNTVKLICKGSKGYLYVNESFIAELDLSARTNSGGVVIATGITNGDEINGYSTKYQDFKVWEIP